MAFFRPLSDAYSVNILTDAERTRILSVFNTLLLVSVIPAAPIGGLIYSLHPRLLFAAVALILAAAIVIIKMKFSYGEEERASK
jgi:MFS family permease